MKRILAVLAVVAALAIPWPSHNEEGARWQRAGAAAEALSACATKAALYQGDYLAGGYQRRLGSIPARPAA